MEDSGRWTATNADKMPKEKSPRRCATISFPGGAGEDRTLDLLHAKQALSQLSYGPMTKAIIARAFISVKRKVRDVSPEYALSIF